jgi:hypothetical protein
MTRILLVSLTAIPLLGACATLQASATEVTPQQTAMLQATCSKVMRLKDWMSEYEGCVSSLSDSLAYQVHQERIGTAYAGCAQSGLKRDTVEFSRCVLDRENAGMATGGSPGGSAATHDAAYVTQADTNPEDYFEASFDTRHRREQYACAQIGLQPESGAFVSCVNKLDSDLFNIEHPPG